VTLTQSLCSRIMLAITSLASNALVENWYDMKASTPKAAATPVNTPLKLSEMIGAGPETGAGLFGNEAWDPLDFAGETNRGLYMQGEMDRLAWFRAAEYKHGRVAMAAFVGYLATSAGLFLPGDVTLAGMKFADLGTDPWKAWEMLPESGRQQIILSVGVMEFLGEVKQPHYTMGGEPGRVPSAFRFFFWAKSRVDTMSEEERKKKLTSELKNGRLAMIGMAGFYAASTVKGSVPFLTPYFENVQFSLPGLS